MNKSIIKKTATIESKINLQTTSSSLPIEYVKIIYLISIENIFLRIRKKAFPYPTYIRLTDKERKYIFFKKPQP
jgi:hypothetical protein